MYGPVISYSEKPSFVIILQQFVEIRTPELVNLVLCERGRV